MLIVVGGIPNMLFSRFQQLMVNIFGAGHNVIARPVQPRPDGRFALSSEYGQQLATDLARRIEATPELADQGCVVFALGSSEVDRTEFVRGFHPFAIVHQLDLPLSTITVGTRGRQTMNEIAKSLRAAMDRLRPAVKAINNELTSRRNRTPLLLPLRNFHSSVLPRELDYLFESLTSSPDPGSTIKSTCDRIERAHPFTKRGGASFYDEKGVRFKAPGRALHGKPSSAQPPHMPSCLLNGRLRLGGASHPGFHYDCTSGETGKLSGDFPDCHDSVASYSGKPHLNVAPNDYIR